MVPETDVEGDYIFYGEAHFLHLLRVERRRTERSGRPFLLALLDVSELLTASPHQDIPEKIQATLNRSLRETDIRGWYEHNRVMGIIFTEMATIDDLSIDNIFHKIHDRLCEGLDKAWIKKISASYHVFPETKGKASSKTPFNMALYADLTKENPGRQALLTVKRGVDIVGGAFAMLLFSPVFLAAAVAITLTSEGPIFFRQERLGLNGKPFTILKFRSMVTNSNPKKHQDYIQKYIGEQENAAVEPGVFKLSKDSRVTPAGRWLRKTSFDELPQFINVLKGDMSLVGPRPPIPYECELYDIWHWRRLLSCKPGITGLWQVTGRSRTTFDDMVRLDLRYISEWSLWLDLKIIFKTPKAVFGGKGAY